MVIRIALNIVRIGVLIELALGILFWTVFQTRWLIGSNHWVIQVIHLLLGLSAIGLAEMIGGRYRRMTANKAAA